jgi:hypothetical protein
MFEKIVIFIPSETIKSIISTHVDPLLGNDHKISSYATAVAI